MKKSLALLSMIFVLFCNCQAQQCIPNTTNGGFEQPSGCGSFCTVNASTVPEWSTTASDNMIEIWSSGFLGVPAYEGNQFAELNANQASTLYIDICTPCSNTVNWSFAHRGRSGVDVIALKAGPPGGPYTQLGIYSDGNTAWGFYTGIYAIPSGQSVTRFLYESVSSSGGNSTFGNFLDAVSFSYASALTVNSPTICAGQTATLTAGGATSYSWSSGLSSTTGATVTGSPSTTTSYTVTGTSSGCPSTAIATITIGTNLTPTVNSPTICAGQTATLTAGNATSYVWTAGLSSASGATVTGSPTTTTSYTVTGTSGNCAGSAIATVTVKPVPILTNSTLSQTVCSGSNSIIVMLTSNVPSTTFGWTATATVGITGFTASGTGNIPAETINTTGSTTGTITYAITPTINGCSGVSTNYTIAVTPLPAISVNSVTICPGQNAVLTATNSTTYSWTNGQTINPITVSPPSTTSYTVTGTSLGCSATAIAIVTVSSTIPVNINSDTICIGQSSTLTSTTAATYSWSNGQTVNPIIVSPLATTTYTVNIATGTCSGTGTSTVIVNPLPTATLSGGAVICPTTSTPITIALTGTAPWTIVYTDGTASTTVPNILTSPYIIAATTIGTFSLSSVTDANCIGTSSGSAVVTFKPYPTALISGGSVVCQGQTVLPVTISLTGTGPWNITYTDGAASTTVTSVNPTYSIDNNNPGSGTYSVLAVSDSICPGTSSGSALVIINPLPTATVGPNVIGCIGSVTPSVTIALTGTSPWNINYTDGTTGTTAVALVSPFAITNPSVGNYSVTSISDGNNCIGTFSGNASVVINPVPAVSVNSLTICNGEPATLIATPIPTGGTYSWSPTGSMIDSITISPGITTTYTVTYTFNSCPISGTGIVTVNPNPIAIFSAPAVTSIINPAVNFIDNSVGAITWNWDFGDTLGAINNTNTLQNPTHTYSTTGTFCVTLAIQNAFGCVDTFPLCLVIDPEIVFPNAFTPNPDGSNGGYYNINSLDNDVFHPYTSGVVEFEFDIFDRWGELVFESKDLKEGWDGYYKGVLCQQGVYIWKARIKSYNGVFNKSGDVILLR
ncbi:MAG: PKD domain-containing protein [Bacteroidota bacterium]